MHEIPLKQVIDASLENLKEVISVDNVIGKPITLPDETVVIPVSKVSVGFTSGGVDFDGKHNPTRQQPHFGGGNGAGMTITPLSFLVISKGNVQLLNISDPGKPSAGNIVGTISDMVDRSPEIIDKIMVTLQKYKKPKKDKESDAAQSSSAVENTAENASEDIEIITENM